MSDAARKGFGEQAKEKMTPDSQKSTVDKASEKVTGMADKAAAAVQPSDSKSTSQGVFDSARGGKNDAKDGAKGYVAQAQDMAGSAAQVVSDNLKGASDYISGSSGAVKK